MPVIFHQNALSRLILLPLLFLAGVLCFSCGRSSGSSLHTYYFSIAGNDNNTGTKQNPFQTLQKLNSLLLQAGDRVYLNGGNTFSGSILLKDSMNGSQKKPIIISSYGNGNAIINAENNSAFIINKASFVNVSHLILKGAGRKNGNTKDGVFLNNCHDINVSNIDVSGFQKSGLFIYNSSQINADDITAHDNGLAGIYAMGNGTKQSCSNINITNSRAENNPGDPTNFSNHSGNGILVGFCKNVFIDKCTATNNGWDMPRTGNGPVGIWCYEADSVVIQRCLSYKNKTAPGASDGGGFDLDGGVTNSIIQYCLSYGNQGSGYGIFQYDGASVWSNNIIRYCISENDGTVSAAHANAFIWNSSHDSLQFKNLFFYNNTFYNNAGASLSYSIESEHVGFHFYNNIFVAKDSLITGKEYSDIFLGNNWYSLQTGLNVEGFNTLQSWALNTGKEQINGQIKGSNVNLLFANAGNTNLTNASELAGYKTYQMPPSSLQKILGVNVPDLFGAGNAEFDFNGKPVTRSFIGACVY